MSYSQFQHWLWCWRGSRFSTLHSALHAALLYTNFLPWQSLAGTYPLGVSFLLWFGSSWNYNLLPGLEAVPQLSLQVLCCVQHCPSFPHQNISLVCENFINECIYYGFLQQKRSPIVLGSIQTFSVLDRFCSKWMLAMSGAQRGGRLWHSKRMVVCKSWCCDLICPGRFLFVVLVSSRIFFFFNVSGRQKWNVRESRKENKLGFFWTSPVFLQLVCQGQMVKERKSCYHFDACEGRLVSSPLL